MKKGKGKKGRGAKGGRGTRQKRIELGDPMEII
jgi:hypothetical protein